MSEDLETERTERDLAIVEAYKSDANMQILADRYRLSKNRIKDIIHAHLSPDERKAIKSRNYSNRARPPRTAPVPKPPKPRVARGTPAKVLERWRELARMYVEQEMLPDDIAVSEGVGLATVYKAIERIVPPDVAARIRRRHKSRASHRSQQKQNAERESRNARIVEQWLRTDLSAEQIGREVGLTATAIYAIIRAQGLTPADRAFEPLQLDSGGDLIF